MSISMYNLDDENKNKFCGGIIVSSHDLVANVMYEAIRCKSFPELPRHAHKLLDDVKEIFEKDCESIGDDFKYRKFKDVNEIKDWLYKNIFPLQEIQQLNISKDEKVTIPYGLFEKMLENQKEITRIFCRTVIIIFTILVLFMLALLIGYFVLRW